MESDVGRRLTAVSPALSTWPSALRRGGVMAALLIAGVVTGNTVAGIAATTGALNIALLDAVLPRAALARALWLCTATTTVVGAVAVVVGDSWWLVPFLAALGFLQGALSTATVAFANAVIANMITAILFASVPGSWQDAVRLSAWLAAGAVIETGVALVSWHWERQGQVRRQAALALLARADGDGERAATYAQAARRSLLTAELAPDERLCFLQVLAIAESPDPPDSAEDLRRAARVLRRQTRAAAPGEWSQRLAVLQPTRGATERQVRAHPDTAPFGEQIRSARRLVLPGTAPFSAGVRLGVLMAIGTLLVIVTDLPQGHWLLLVFALSVRPDYQGTVATLWARVIGVVAAVLLMNLLALLAGEATGLLLGLAVVSGVLTCRWITGNATLFFFWLTVFVSVLVDVPGLDPALGWYRLRATLIGVAVALMVSRMWPGWGRTRPSPG